MAWIDLTTWPPLHPMFVHFTSALLPVSLGLDVVGKIFRRESMLHAAWWTMLIGTLITPLTVLYGWRWWWSMDAELSQQMQLHQWLGTGLMVVYVLLAIWRGRAHWKATRPSWAYLIVLLLVTAALWVQGHSGAVMSYGE